MESLQELVEVEEFFQRNQKTLQLLLKWETNNLQKLQTKLNEMEETEPLGVQDEELKYLICGTFAMSPRFMFEFLDENNIIVEIKKAEEGFSYSVNDESVDTSYTTRLEAEKAAFREAIIKLENQLV